MVKIIKDETGCNVTVGQNGYIWIEGETVEDELFAKKAINFVSDNSYQSGLTEKLQKWFAENKK